MEGNLLQQYYMETHRLSSRIYKHLKRIVEFYTVKNPGANVLEIGAGTGGATQTVLEAFSCKGDGSGSLLGRYTFTDVSAGSFEAASQKLAPWTSMMDFAKLNIEFDPVKQFFAANSYDLIIASMALHETASLHKTMSHICKLLKPGGKVLLVENTKDRLDMQLIFGTLPS
ncbi:S-adenosyl-L-methionine-dependent methyltransferase [Usnea florida]